jgi:hypothetical protein
VLYRTGDWKGAITNLEKAIGLRTPETHFNATNGFFLVMAHRQLGDIEKARRHHTPGLGRTGQPHLLHAERDLAECASSV